MTCDLFVCGSESCVETGDGSPVRLIRTRGMIVAAALRKAFQFLRNYGLLIGYGELGAQGVQWGQIIGEQRLGRTAECELEGVSGDVWIAVAIATDPASGSQ